MLQRQQQGIADAYLHSAALAQRASQASAANQAQAQMHAASLDQQSYLGEQQAALARQQMAHQSDMQSQHAQLQDQLAQNQLSRGEQMRLQRLQEARGTIQSQVASGSLTQEEGNDALMQIQTGISPLQQRQHRAQTLMLQQQHEAMQRQVAQFDQLQREREDYRTSSAQSHIETVTLDDGQDYQFHRDEQGRRTFLGAHGSGAAVWQQGDQVAPGTTRTRDNQTRGQGGQQGTEPAFDPRVHAAALHEVQAAAARDEAGHQRPVNDADVRRRYDEMMGVGQGQAPPRADRAAVQRQVWQQIGQQFPQATVDERRRLRDAMMPEAMQRANQPAAEHAQDRRLIAEQTRAVDRDIASSGIRFTPQTRQRAIDERVQSERERLRAARPPSAADQLNALGRRIRGEDDQVRPGQTAVPLRQHTTDQERFADSSRRFTQEEIGHLPPLQQIAANSMNTLRSLLSEPGTRYQGRTMTVAERTELEDSLNSAQQILTRYGSEAAMPSGEHSRFALARDRLARLGVPAPSRTHGEPTDPLNRWIYQNIERPVVNTLGAGGGFTPSS